MKGNRPHRGRTMLVTLFGNYYRPQRGRTMLEDTLILKTSFIQLLK